MPEVCDQGFIELMNNEILYTVPLIFLFSILVVLLLISSEIGYRVGSRFREQGPNMPELVPTSIFGILALLLGFTLSMAVTRYETRTNLMIKEANAISTAALRADLFQAPHGTEIRKWIGQYLDDTIAGFETESGKGSMQSEQQLWKAILEGIKAQRDPHTALMVVAYNDMVDRRADVIFARKNHVPESVYYLIMIISLVGIGTLGYVSGYNGVRHIPTFILIFLLSLTIAFIQDIDRPTRGIIKINSDVMRQLKATF